MRHTRPPQGCGAATPRSFRPHVAYAGFKRVYPRHAFSPHMGRFPKSITTGRAGAKQARLQRPPPEKRDACAFHMQDPFCLGRAFCGLPAGSVFSKCRLEYRARPQATPTACAGPVRACFWHTAQSAGLFPFPRPASPRPLFQRRGGRSGNPPLAASPARRRGEGFLQATTGRAGAARALCPFPKQNTRARREKLQTGQNTGESCGRPKS